MTNDGELAQKLTHPSHGHSKEYRVLLARQPDTEQLATWQRGVVLEDGYKTQHADVRIESLAGKGAWVRIVMREGRKRQIREIGAMLALPVVRIVRIRIGNLLLGDLKPAEWRYLTPLEIKALQDDRPGLAPYPDMTRKAPRKFTPKEPRKIAGRTAPPTSNGRTPDRSRPAAGAGRGAGRTAPPSGDGRPPGRSGPPSSSGKPTRSGPPSGAGRAPDRSGPPSGEGKAPGRSGPPSSGSRPTRSGPPSGAGRAPDRTGPSSGAGRSPDRKGPPSGAGKAPARKGPSSGTGKPHERSRTSNPSDKSSDHRDQPRDSHKPFVRKRK